jgi:hypothetical protein
VVEIPTSALVVVFTNLTTWDGFSTYTVTVSLLSVEDPDIESGINASSSTPETFATDKVGVSDVGFIVTRILLSSKAVSELTNLLLRVSTT